MGDNVKSHVEILPVLFTIVLNCNREWCFVFIDYWTFLTSLNARLQHVVRPSIPDAVLDVFDEDDRIMLENILYVALEVFPTISMNLATASKEGTVFRVRLPFCADTQARLSCMQQLQNFSPARVSDVWVVLGGVSGTGALILEICAANARLSCTQFDIVRMCKRQRR